MATNNVHWADLSSSDEDESSTQKKDQNSKKFLQNKKSELHSQTDGNDKILRDNLYVMFLFLRLKNLKELVT